MNTKINKFLKKLLSAVLASVMVFGSTSPPLAVQAAGSYPDISAVIGDLDESEIVRAGDIEFEAGDDVNIEKEGISYDAGKVTVKLASAKDSGGASYKKGRAGTYTAKYNCTPGSGAPSYSVTRKITVKETKTLAASPEAPGAGEEQKAPAQEKEPEPEPEPEPKAEPQEAAKEEKTEEKAPAQEEEAGSEETESESDPEAESEEAADKKRQTPKILLPKKRNLQNRHLPTPSRLTKKLLLLKKI